MRRPRARKKAAGVELFSFLAVLMCAMGALILLLLLVARSARSLPRAQPGAQPAARSAERERLERRLAALKRARVDPGALLRRQGKIEELAGQAKSLRQRLAELEAAEVDLTAAAQGARIETSEELERKLAALKRQILDAEEELDRATRSPAQEKSYSIVPYEGPHGSRRRPIYIECLADGILLQPEGLVLTEADFPEPLDASNPLAAAVRAACDQLARSGEASDGEPYPLLIVRPEGIAAYYTARAALGSLGSDFGYEFVEQDWDLEYDSPDPLIARAERLAIQEARARQRILALGRLPQGPFKGRAAFRVAPSGAGLVRADGGDTAESWPGRRATGTPVGTVREGAASARREAARPPAAFTGLRPPQDRSQEPSPGEAMASDQRRTAADWRPGEYRERMESGGSVASLAVTRGENWGLPDSSKSSISITRPIRIQCDQDRMAVLPETGDRDGKVILLEEETAQSVDALVSAIWERMDEWGLAGKGMYWRPILQMEVTPEGEGRYADLEDLLAGSGLTVRRKEARLPSARLPDTHVPSARRRGRP